MQPHRHDTLESLKFRPEFYRRMYRVVLKVVLANSFLLAILCAITVYLGFYGFKPEHYFTTSPNSRIIELQYKVQPPYRKPIEESQGTHAQPAAP
ncbi:MAG TPA: hypothetical protein PKW15_02075 [Alphaproteobacteria bacterium]|nr:hypothetical protein [Rhodospirillaceae bacterium]HRJ12011.1 hypothetical protein [Alphaproteobacteria bacterium]